MEKRYVLIFDNVMIKQLKKAAKDGAVKQILKKMFDRLEENGPEIGKLLDHNLFIYELKLHHPPIRLYYVPSSNTNEIKVFEFEMKTSPKKQRDTIENLREQLSKS